MRKTAILIPFLFAASTILTAQKKKITLQDIWGGAFRTEGMDVLRSMKNGKQYTVLNFERNPKSSSLDKYDYTTLEKVETIIASSGCHSFFLIL